MSKFTKIFFTFSIVFVIVFAFITVFNNINRINREVSSSSYQSASTSGRSSPPIERGYFSAETFAQQRALREFEDMKKEALSDDSFMGGSISPVSGSSVSYDSSLNCSAVVIKNFDPDKFNGVSKNINFFMDDGSQAIIILDSIDHIKGVQINDQYTDAYGSCSTDYGNSLSCMIHSSNGSMIGGTRSNIIHIQAFTLRGASLSR